MPHSLHVPGARPKALKWTTSNPLSHQGGGVLVYRNTASVLDGAAFRRLRDEGGAWIETDRPDRVRSALGLMPDESFDPPLAEQT